MIPQTSSGRLRHKIGLASLRLEAASSGFWNHPRLVELYPHALVTSYTIVRATVPLMEKGRDRARQLASRDPLCAEIVTYLEGHIPEECGHDEWILDDLEVLGVGRKQASQSLPSPTSAAMVGAQYYWIEHVHPVAVLGYIAVLEGDPPREEDIGRVIERSGLPPSSFSTLLRHAKLDPYHRADLDAALDRMPMSSDQRDVLGVSALATLSLLAQVLEEVVLLAPIPRQRTRRSNEANAF
jgi:Iron-containing redox enzyme